MVRVRGCRVFGLEYDGKGMGENDVVAFLMLQDEVQYWE
jgi:hypothetical protein